MDNASANSDVAARAVVRTSVWSQYDLGVVVERCQEFHQPVSRGNIFADLGLPDANGAGTGRQPSVEIDLPHRQALRLSLDVTRLEDKDKATFPGKAGRMKIVVA